MELRKITAIVRCETLEAVEKRLPLAGAKGLTVTQVKGYGEYADFFSRDWQVRHVRLEIFTEAPKVKAIVAAIMDAASTAAPGDGIIAVLPVEEAYRVRSRSHARSGEL